MDSWNIRHMTRHVSSLSAGFGSSLMDQDENNFRFKSNWGMSTAVSF